MLCRLTIDRFLIRHQQHVSRASRSLMPSLTVVPHWASFFVPIDISSVQQSTLSQYFFLLPLLHIEWKSEWDKDFTYGKKLLFDCVWLCVVTRFLWLFDLFFIYLDYKSLSYAGLVIAAVLFVFGILVITCKYLKIWKLFLCFAISCNSLPTSLLFCLCLDCRRKVQSAAQMPQEVNKVSNYICNFCFISTKFVYS